MALRDRGYFIQMTGEWNYILQIRETEVEAQKSVVKRNP